MKDKKKQIRSFQRKILRREQRLETLTDESARRLTNYEIKDFQTQLKNLDQEYIRLDNKTRQLALDFEDEIKTAQTSDWVYYVHLGNGTEEQKKRFSKTNAKSENGKKNPEAKIENDQEKPKAKVHNHKEIPRSWLSKFFGFKNHHQIDAKNENAKGKRKGKLKPWPPLYF
jgi:hypothetical protein